jgi:hypothetical protein
MKNLLQPLIKWINKRRGIDISHRHMWQNTSTYTKLDYSYMHEIFECKNCNKIMHVIRRPRSKAILKIVNKKMINNDHSK